MQSDITKDQKLGKRVKKKGRPYFCEGVLLSWLNLLRVEAVEFGLVEYRAFREEVVERSAFAGGFDWIGWADYPHIAWAEEVDVVV